MTQVPSSEKGYVTSIQEGDLLWEPSLEFISKTNMKRFQSYVEAKVCETFKTYQELWKWSVENLELFWELHVEFWEIEFDAPHQCILNNVTMPGAEWFPGATLNFAKQALSPSRGEEPALIALSETRKYTEVTWDELESEVRRVATALRQRGVKPGDRVVSLLPNIKEAAVALLATAAIGAVFSSCSPDFGSKSVIDRFSQIQPRAIFVCDGYRYGGKDFSCTDTVSTIIDALPSLETIIMLPFLDVEATPQEKTAILYSQLIETVQDPGRHYFEYESVPFEHPLWIVYSSGTTGLPKPIVHGHGGVVLEMFKFLGFHLDIKAGERNFFFTTTGWVMWNITLSSLLVGGTAIIYDGNPAYPSEDILWKMAADAKATVFGASPTYISLMMKAGIVPNNLYDLSNMRTVMLGGSPATPESMKWFYDCVGDDLWVTSQSGGTDVCSAFVGASPTLNVRAGIIQTKMLAVDVCALDAEGNDIIGEIGELVIRNPMPSMPIKFWNDPDNQRYQSSYFDVYPGLWRHGDYINFDEEGGSVIIGRSDSTLNRYGVRIGTSEIYRIVESIEGVSDSLIVNLDLSDGKFFMPLFVQLAEGVELDEPLVKLIKSHLKSQGSPRHVPDAIFKVDAIPYTLTGKKMEVPVRKILMGAKVADAANPDAMKDPSAIFPFEGFDFI